MRPRPEVFSLDVVQCPACNHGIDPHTPWGDGCGVGVTDDTGRSAFCPCTWSPNDIAGTLLGWRIGSAS